MNQPATKIETESAAFHRGIHEQMAMTRQRRRSGGGQGPEGRRPFDHAGSAAVSSAAAAAPGFERKPPEGVQARRVEPTSAESVAQWIQTAQRQRDPFEHVRLASHEHRESHGAGCSVYPTSSGPLLSVLAAAPSRLSGFSRSDPASAIRRSAWLMAPAEWSRRSNATPSTWRSPSGQFCARVTRNRFDVLHGRGADVLPRLDGPCDLDLSDGDPEELPQDLDHFLRLLRPGGLLLECESLPRSVRTRP